MYSIGIVDNRKFLGETFGMTRDDCTHVHSAIDYQNSKDGRAHTHLYIMVERSYD